MRDTPGALKLALTEGVGPVLIKRFIDAFPGESSMEEKDTKLLAEESGISETLLRRIIDSLNNESEEAKEVVRRTYNAGFCICPYGSYDYPTLLGEIYDPPPVLYYSGKISLCNINPVAVVGTRRPTEYGVEAARRVSAKFARRGLTLVSGCALGIDAAAQYAALDEGGSVAGVLGSSLERLYPAQNIPLMKRIMESGVLISEHPPGSPTAPSNFPARNRIISGLSLGTLIVEAPERSGALITAYQALEQGREVGAIPGSVFSIKSRGSNTLIREGAALIRDADDFIEEVLPRLKDVTENASGNQTLTAESLSDGEQAVIEALEEGILHIDEIRARTGISACRLSALLTKMELSGALRALKGKKYTKV